jgi:hypothetical protein
MYEIPETNQRSKSIGSEGSPENDSEGKALRKGILQEEGKSQIPRASRHTILVR